MASALQVWLVFRVRLTQHRKEKQNLESDWSIEPSVDHIQVDPLDLLES